MMNDELEVNSAIREVIKKAVVDHDFRQLAVRDSKAAIAKVSGKKLPEGMSIHFVDNYQKSTKTIALPDPIANASELTDEELEQVAGGCGASSCGVSSRLRE
jgi:hypothetical protein